MVAIVYIQLGLLLGRNEESGSMKSYSSARFTSHKKWMNKRSSVSRRHEFSKISDEALYAVVKEKLVDYAQTGNGRFPVRAEWYANEFQVPIHRITQLFMRLNHEGLMSQRSNEKTDLPWNASYYYVRSK